MGVPLTVLRLDFMWGGGSTPTARPPRPYGTSARPPRPGFVVRDGEGFGWGNSLGSVTAFFVIDCLAEGLVVESIVSSYLSVEYKSSSSGLDKLIGLFAASGVFKDSFIFSFLISRDIPVDLVSAECVNFDCSFVSRIVMIFDWVFCLVEVDFVAVCFMVDVDGVLCESCLDVLFRLLIDLVS